MIEKNTLTKLTKRSSYNPRIILVDGLSGTGKVIIQDLLLSLRNCSKYYSSMILEQIVVSEMLNGDKESYGNAFMKQIIDNLAYNHCIGRDSNTRISDHSSILKTPHLIDEVLKLTRSGRGEKETTYLINKKNIIQLFVHSTSFFNTIYEDNFERLTPIYIIRSPLNVIPTYAKYLPRIIADPREFTPKISFNGKDIPWYFHENPDLFFSLTDIEASAFIHAYAYKSLFEKLKSKNGRNDKDIFLFDFEDLIKKPFETIGWIGNKLNLKYNSISLRMQAFRNNVPRKTKIIDKSRSLTVSRKGETYFEEAMYWYMKLGDTFRSLR